MANLITAPEKAEFLQALQDKHDTFSQIFPNTIIVRNTVTTTNIYGAPVAAAIDTDYDFSGSILTASEHTGKRGVTDYDTSMEETSGGLELQFDYQIKVLLTAPNALLIGKESFVLINAEEYRIEHLAYNKSEIFIYVSRFDG